MRYEAIVVGGGIVGLALAYTILRHKPGSRLLLLEKEATVGRHQTGHNSGVIHSGIYYKPGSHKARTCRRGYRLLLDFCARHEVPYEICGKVVVATEERELPFLAELHRRGEGNGLVGMRWLDSTGIKEFEPHVAGVRGLLVPETGIVDFSAVAAKLQELILQLGGEVRCGQEVITLDEKVDGVEVITQHATFGGRLLVNCGGLHSDRLARQTQPDLAVRIIPFRGEYYELRPEKRHLVNNLIYPVPDPAFPFLGVHFTRMINGGVEAGPNAVLAGKREGYRRTDFACRDFYESVSWPGLHKLAARCWRAGLAEIYRSWNKQAFVTALQKLLPELTADDLVPGGAGVRAQACDRDGKLVDDFFFVSQPRILHVCNAPSPAATASLAIGEYLHQEVQKRLP